MASGIEELVVQLGERIEGRFFGKYRGQVSDNQDPSNLGRLRAKVPRLLREEETGWALPAFPYGGAAEQGFYAVPDVGAGVWIEFEEGDLSYPIWSGTWFASGDIPESATPAKKVWKTKAGHKLVLDDDAGSLEITDANGNTVTMDSSGKVLVQAVSLAVVDAPQIQLVENSTHPLVFGDQLLQYLNQVAQMYQVHVHPGETVLGIPVTPAPPVPPVPPATPSLLSTTVTTG